MPLILSIETSTSNCSVAIYRSDCLISLVEKNTQAYIHSESLHSFIISAVNQAEIHIKDIDAIAVSKGPGSYTGLRIGVSAAKGLCYALDKPLIAVSTLEILAKQIKEKSYIYAVIDARRDEVYSALYDQKYKQVRHIQSEIICEATHLQLSNYQPLTILGTGADKCKELMPLSSDVKVINTVPSAKELGLWAVEKYNRKAYENVTHFEPYYLKDFISR